MTKDDSTVVLAGRVRDRARRVEVERQGAEVLDDHEIRSAERGAIRGRRSESNRSGRRWRRTRDPAGRRRRPPAVLDRARDAAHLETSSPSPRPLLRFDRHAVGSSEPERHDDSLRRHPGGCSGLRDHVWLIYAAGGWSRRAPRARPRRLPVADARSPIPTRAVPTRQHEDNRDDRDVVHTDPKYLGLVDVDALGCRFELAQRIDRRGADEPVARGGRD